MVASVQAQIQTRDREKKLSVLTNKELSSLAPETVTYKSVGKMYVVVGAVVVVVFEHGRSHLSDAPPTCRNTPTTLQTSRLTH